MKNGVSLQNYLEQSGLTKKDDICLCSLDYLQSNGPSCLNTKLSISFVGTLTGGTHIVQ